MEPIVSANWVKLPWGDFTSTVVSGRTTYTLTPRMFVNALLQFNSSAKTLSTNARLRWEYRPGRRCTIGLPWPEHTNGARKPSLEERVAYLEGRMEDHTRAVGDLRGAMGDLREHMDRRFGDLQEQMGNLREQMERRFEVLDQKVDRHFTWLVGIQVAVLVPIVGTLVGSYYK